LNQGEAAELLGVSERTFRRWRDRYDEAGEAGLLDRRLGKTSGRRVPVDRAEEVEALHRERYQGFTVKHFHEHLVKDHGFGCGYTWTKLHLQWAGVVAKAQRRGAHRRKCQRRPVRCMMLHQDGSRHEWLEGQAALLIVTMYDATGAIYSAFLIEEEGTALTFGALKEVFSRQGVPVSLYTDRGSHYFCTTKAGEIDRGCPTQVGRALAQLGVEHIGAFSPQARSAGVSFESISCGGEVVFAFFGLEEIADLADGSPESVDGADGSGAQIGLEFCESHLNRVEIGAVGRQKQNPCALVVDGFLGDRTFVRRQIVHDDDVALFERRARWVST
jgi:transposase